MKYIFKSLWFILIHIFFVIAIIFERIYATLFCILSILWNVKISKTESFRRLTYYRFGDGENSWANTYSNSYEIERAKRTETFSSFANMYKSFYNNFINDLNEDNDKYFRRKLYVENNFKLATFNY